MLLLLTGQRRNEVFDVDRREFDLPAKLWTIPGERARNGASHLVPLSPAAVSIVKGSRRATSSCLRAATGMRA